jgi:predicted Zn-dependent protease
VSRDFAFATGVPNNGAPRRLLGAEAHGVLAPSTVLSREEAQSLVERVVGMSKADAVSVSVQSARETNLRFADNQMSTSGATTNTTVRVQSVFGKRKASVLTNDRTEAGLRRAVEQSEAIARLAPEDPEYLGELGAQTYAPVSAWFDSTAELSAEDRAKAALTALAPARASNDLTVAGFIVCEARATALGNSAGLFAYHRSTNANYTLTARTNDGTGSVWAAADSGCAAKCALSTVTSKLLAPAAT